MVAATKQEAIGEISAIELTHYADRAAKDGRLKPEQANDAMADYRQFLLLIWANHVSAGREFIIPTERADQIWHEHILDTAVYRAFCERLIGRYVDHHPGLEKGTAPHVRAADHTRALHRAYGGDAFSDSYLGADYRNEKGSARDGKPRSGWRRWIGGHFGGAGCGGGGDTGGSSCGGCGGGGD